jgi:hypothetical protein
MPLQLFCLILSAHLVEVGEEVVEGLVLLAALLLVVEEVVEELCEGTLRVK